MYKVWVLAAGETTYATNALTFDTIEEAKTYGQDLFMRWYSVEKWCVIPTEKAESGYLSKDFVEENAVYRR
jgi:hypothetical protein